MNNLWRHTLKYLLKSREIHNVISLQHVSSRSTCLHACRSWWKPTKPYKIVVTRAWRLSPGRELSYHDTINILMYDRKSNPYMWKIGTSISGTAIINFIHISLNVSAFINNTSPFSNIWYIITFSGSPELPKLLPHRRCKSSQECYLNFFSPRRMRPS